MLKYADDEVVRINKASNWRSPKRKREREGVVLMCSARRKWLAVCKSVMKWGMGSGDGAERATFMVTRLHVASSCS